jgi:hypothetical protein
MWFYGRVIQDGDPVVSVSARTCEGMLRELAHYAKVYSQDGPVRLETRSDGKRWQRYKP